MQSFNWWTKIPQGTIKKQPGLHERATKKLWDVLTSVLIEVGRTGELKTGRLVETHEAVRHSKSIFPLWQKTDSFKFFSLNRITLRIDGLGNPSRVGAVIF